MFPMCFTFRYWVSLNSSPCLSSRQVGSLNSSPVLSSRQFGSLCCPPCLSARQFGSLTALFVSHQGGSAHRASLLVSQYESAHWTDLLVSQYESAHWTALLVSHLAATSRWFSSAVLYCIGLSCPVTSETLIRNTGGSLKKVSTISNSQSTLYLDYLLYIHSILHR